MIFPIKKKDKAPKMQVVEIKTRDVLVEYFITFAFYKDTWSVIVRTKNHEVYGNCNTNVSTSQLAYFDIPIETRERHFEQFKKLIYESGRKKP